MSLAAVRPSRVFGINTEITIRPITVCSSETPSASLLLTFPQARYLFNCPENTSRSFVQARTPAKYLSAIFLASPRAEHSAGLHGFLLGMADLQREKLIRVVGPHGTRYMAACGRLYTRREGMAVEVLEFPDRNGFEQVYEDDHISVYAVGSQPPTIASKRPLGSSRTSPAANKRQKVSSASEGEEEPQESPVASDSENLDVQAPSTASRQEKDPSAWLDLVLQDMFRPKAGAQKHPASVRPHPTPAYSYEKLEPPTEPITLDPSSYFVVGPKLRGKFSVEKAQALGVQPGPDFGKLWKGEKVVLSDGTTVDGKMCVGEGSNGSAFYISNITSLKQLHRTTLPLPQEMTELGQGARLAAVFHFVGPDILSDEGYVDWLSKFEPETKHYLSSHAYSPDLYSFEPAVFLLLKLSLLSPTLFPIPHCRLDSLQSHSVPNLSQLDRFQDIQINLAVPQPPALVRLDYELIENPVSKSELIQKIELVPEVPEVLDRIQQEEREIQEPASNVFADRIMITTLGTSSAVPSKYRNVSATLLHIPLNEQEPTSDFYYVLLDAGEGTLGQIKRSFGQRWGQVLRAIKLIFISHLHADHHSGLSSILIERNKLAGVLPLVLVCQYGVNLYLRERSLIEPMGLDADSVRWVDVEKLIGTPAPDQARSFEINNILPEGLELETVRVIHWGKCYGLCISHRTQAWKIVFSGDTKHCADLIEVGQGADLLIHEASLGVDEKALAESKGHCTIDQAIAVGLEMKAKNCILNHFSSRYPKIPDLEAQNNLDEKRMNIGISFDLMTCRIGDVSKLERYLPAFEQLVKKPEKEVEEVVGELAGEEVNGTQAAKPKAKTKTKGHSSPIVKGAETAQKVRKGNQNKQNKKNKKSDNLGDDQLEMAAPTQSAIPEGASVEVLEEVEECPKGEDKNLSKCAEPAIEPVFGPEVGECQKDEDKDPAMCVEPAIVLAFGPEEEPLGPT